MILLGLLREGCDNTTAWLMLIGACRSNSSIMVSIFRFRYSNATVQPLFMSKMDLRAPVFLIRLPAGSVSMHNLYL